MSLLIKNIALYRDGKTEENCTVSVRGNRIDGFPCHPDESAYDEVIDGKDCLAMPGLVNAHTHVAMTLFRSYADDMALMDWLQNKIWPAEARLNDDIVYWGSLLAFAEMIRGGTTAFCDMYMFMDACARAAVSCGIRGNIARGLAGVSPNGEEALQENVELFQKWNGAHDGLIRVMLGPHAPYTCPPEYLKKVCAAAEKWGIPIHIHLCETKGEVEKCREKFGMTPIALMESIGLFDHPVLAAHCVHVTGDDIRIMADHHVCVAHNPGSNLKLASGIAPVPAMRQAGITVGLGTDGASSNNNLDMFEEMRLAALIHKGALLDPFAVTAPEAVSMATEEGAKCLGYSDLGRLEEGALADLILVDRSGFHWQPRFNNTSLLAYSANSMDVDTVIVNGRVLMKNRELLTIDTERLSSEVKRAAGLLFEA